MAWRNNSSKLSTLQVVKSRSSSKDLNASPPGSPASSAIVRRTHSRLSGSDALVKHTNKSGTMVKSKLKPGARKDRRQQPEEIEEAEHLIEYFAVCGIGAESLMESTEGGKCKPVLLDRLPEEGRWSRDLPPQIPQCCLPEGVEIVLAADIKEDVKPKCYPIVLTDEDGTKLYGSCLVFLDWIPEVLAVQNEMLLGAKASKCICLLSRWPFLKSFQKLLEELYNVYFKKGGTRPLVDVMHFLLDSVPVPRPAGPKVFFTIDKDEIDIYRPHNTHFWSHEMSLRPLAQLLDVNNLVKLFQAVLLEKQVILVASQLTLLTNVAEGITALLKPFKWHHIYLPVMPHSLAEYLDSPSPFLMGLNVTVPLEERKMDDKIIVNLEANKVTCKDGLLPPLPEPETKELMQKLRAVLSPNLVDMDDLSGPGYNLFTALQGKAWGPDHDVALSAQFFEYLRALTMGYEHFVKPESMDNIFDKEAFLTLKKHIKDPKKEKGEEVGFDETLAQFADTMAFQQFIEDHIELGQSPFTQETSQQLAAKMHKKTDDPDIHLSPPEVDTLAGLGRRGFKYDTFPPLTEAAATQLNAEISQEEDEEDSILNTLESLLTKSGSSELAKLASEIKTIKQKNATEKKRRHSISEGLEDGDEVDERGMIVRRRPDGSQIVRSSWEHEFITKQQKTLQFTLEAAVEVAVDVNKIDWDRVGDLLAIQKAGAGWDLIQVLVEKLDELELRARAIPPGPFTALCRMIMAIAKHAADKEDFRAILTGLDAAIAIHTIPAGSGGSKEYAISRMRNDPLWFHPWLWDGVLTLALNDFQSQCEFDIETENYYFSLRKAMMRMAGYMTAVGVDEDGVWNMMHRKLNMFLRQHQPGKKGELLLQMRTHLSVLNMMESMRAINTKESKSLPTNVGELTYAAGWKYMEDEEEEEILDDLAAVQGNSLGALLRDKMPDVKATQVHRMHTKPIIRISAKSGFAATASLDWTVRLWELSHKEIKHLGTLANRCDSTSLDMDDQVSYCAIGRMDGNVRLVDTENMKQLLTFRAHNGSVSSTTIDNPRHFIATGGVDGCVRVWDIRSPHKPAANLLSVGAEITCMEFQGYSDFVAVGSASGVCSLFDIRFCSVPVLCGRDHKDTITSIKIVGSGSNAALLSASKDGSARYWRQVGRDARDRVATELKGHEGPVYGATDINLSSKDEVRMIITGSADGSVRLYDTEGGKPKRVVKGLHTQPVTLVSSSPRFIITGSTDNAFISWDEGSMRGVSQLVKKQEAKIPSAKVVSFAHDKAKDYMVSGCQDGTIGLWHPDVEEPVTSLEKLLAKHDSDEDDYEWWSG